MHIVLHYHAAEEGGLLPYGRLFNWDGEDLRGKAPCLG